MISIIIPFYNEKENIPILIGEIDKEMYKIGKEFEIILVDDGSEDNFQFPISNFHKNIKLIKHKKRAGKGQALKTGLDKSIGEVIIFMDGDLQDEPRDLDKFLKKIDEGYDFVNGIRIGRQESLLIKTYSKLAAYFLKKFLNSPYTDINCGYKAFKRNVIKDFSFYGNNFRFFPLGVFYNGYMVTEIEVRNNKRMFGKSKFGPQKLLFGIFDTLTAYFLYKFAERPLHFFGLWGMISFIAGLIILAYLTVERIFFQVMLYRRPILFLGMLLIIIGIQIVMTGIIGELIVYLNKKNDK